MTTFRGPAPPAIYIPATLLERTGDLIATFAELRPAEGVVYWFGIESVSRGVVTTLIVPDADTTTGRIRTSVEANAEALTAIIDTPLVLLGHAHSHPGTYVEHSLTDDAEAFGRFDGALSLVVPYFARYGIDLSDCGVYRHIGGRFRWVDPSDVPAHLVVLPGVVDYRRDRSTEQPLDTPSGRERSPGSARRRPHSGIGSSGRRQR